MSNVNRGHLAGLKMAHDLAQMSSFPVSWEDSLERLIAQASAAPEQEPAGWYMLHFTGTYAEFRVGPRLTGVTFPDMWAPLYTHADDGELERLRAENTALRAAGEVVAGAIPRLDAARQQLAEAQALLRDFYPGCGLTTRKTAVLRKQADAILSATAQPAECETCNDHGLIGDLPMECPDCEPADGVRP